MPFWQALLWHFASQGHKWAAHHCTLWPSVKLKELNAVELSNAFGEFQSSSGRLVAVLRVEQFPGLAVGWLPAYAPAGQISLHMLCL